jgi:predicted PurR-regulated permease PerM
MYILEVTQEKLTMKTMTVRGSPIFRNLLVAAAVVILVFGLKYSSEVLAPIFLAATLAILFTPLLRWLEKKGLHTGLALVVMVLGLGGLIILLIIVLNAAMDNAVTPRIMGKGLNLPILLVFLSFLFWSWVFGFIGALLAIPATLFVKTLLQGREETHFLVVLLSGQGDGNVPVTIPNDRQNESNAGEVQSDTSDDSTATLKLDSADASTPEE